MSVCPSTHSSATHWTTVVVVVGWVALFAGYPLARALPVAMGFENGPIENTQAILLAIGGLVALWMAWRHRHAPQVHFWLAMLPFWMVCAGRELAWGAAFLPPLGMNEEGPVISSRIFTYHWAIAPAIALLALFAGWQFLRYRMNQVVVMRLWHESQFPLRELILFAVAMIVATCAEGHGFMQVPLPAPRAQILEEIAELVGYAGLFLAQVRVCMALSSSVSKKNAP